jgi:class 3 adenylate cyclase
MTSKSLGDPIPFKGEVTGIDPLETVIQVPIRGVKLKYKIMAGSVGVLLFAMLITLTYFFYFYQTETRQTLRENLRVARDTYEKVSELQISRLKSVLGSIQNSPRFLSAIRVALNDIPTLKDSLMTEYEVSGADLVLIADDSGRPLLGLASNVKGFLTWSATERERISKANYLRVHIDDDLPEKLSLNWGDSEIFEDFLVYRGSLYKIVSSALYDAMDNFLGIILLGGRLNQETIGELTRVTGANISFLDAERVFASSLDEFEAKDLAKALPRQKAEIFTFSDKLSIQYALRSSDAKQVASLVVMKSLKGFQKKRQQLLLISGMVVSLVLLLTIGISFLTSNNIVRPLQDLSTAFYQVGEGNLDVIVDIRSGDELEALSQTFNGMVSGLRQKKTMTKFLSGMALKEVEAISEGGKELEYGGEKKLISVLFSDIRSFTTLSENADPATIIRALNYYFQRQIPCITSEGGFLDKLIGDCIMAVFEHEDDYNGADAAMRAAITMQAGLATIRAEMIAQSMPEFHVGFGINTGIAVVGNVGAMDQVSRTVLGDTVNLAARVESLSKEGRESHILFTEYTLEAMQTKIDHEFLMKTVVKGKSIPVSIFEVETSELKLSVDTEVKS